MLHPSALLILLVPFLLCSCIWGVKVSIKNQSTTDHHIQVHYPPSFHFPIALKGDNRDSLPAYDHTLTENAVTSRDLYRYPASLPIEGLDTVARTYSFTLKAKHEVVLQNYYPNSPPAYGHLFIIDNRDTVAFAHKGPFFNKRPKMGKGGSWTYTISSEKN